ncbi:MAG: choice-of-anchor J domain-containing protein, partial [Flavobacteriaceae bacterium]|nr:choice-of-anchor J domain-containing protein [Flavobacteriaceae bacterium]
MKTKFSSKKSLLLLFLIPLTALAFFLFNTKKETATLSENATVAEKYAQFLENHPFRKTMQLSKKERAKLGLPPNKYYEQEWLYTSDPVLLRPAPERVHELQKEIASNPAMRTPVGTGSNVWVERGPDNVGGRTHTLMFAPGSSTKVFAGGVSGGLWVNNNITSSATQWQQVTGVPGNMAVMCMTVDPNDSNTMYIGTGEVYTWGAVNGNGVYKSTDGGNNWTLIYSGGTSAADKITYIQDIIAWNNPSTNQTEIFFGADSMAYTEEVTSTSGGAGWTWLGENTIGLYRSTDGVNFSRLTGSLYESSSGNYFAPNDFDIGADGTLWMGTKYSYYTGEGGGRVFKNTGTGWSLVRDLGDNGRVELGCSKQTANKIYALCEDRTSTTNPVKIYLTTNGFSTAPTSLSQPNDADTGISASDFTRGQSFYDLMIGVDPNNDATVYVGGIDLFKSTNSGSSWSQFSHWYGGFGFQEVHADQHGIAFSSSSRIVFSNDGGVYYTNNGGSTTSARNNGYNVTQFYKGAINQQTSTTKLLAGAQDNGSQFINNAAAGINSSTEIQGGDGCWCFIDQDNQYLITSYVYNSYYRHNYTTGAQQSTIASNTSDGDFVNQCGLDSSTNILYANGTTSTPAYRIYRYSNITGTASRTTLTNTMLDTYPIAFVASPFTNNRILVGTALGKIIRLDNANGTPTWTDISMPGQVGAVSDIRYGQTENDIMVTFHNYGVTSVWYTSNGGSSWVSKEGNLPDMPVKCILQNPLATDEVIIGTELGVWVTSNWSAGSPTWTQSQNGMSDVKVTSFDFRSADNTIIASTYGRGMFTGTFEAATTSAEIGFQTTAQSNAEGTGCSYTDIDVTVSIAQGATANADVSFSVNGSSTATAGVDFDLMTTMVTFPAGSTANQTMTVRVYEDGFVEGDETVIIDLSVNANGGDAVANTSADTYTLTITNDDAAPVASSTNVLGFYDMESLTGWQALDDDGDGNNWLTLTGLTWTGITGTFLGSETDLTILGGSGSATPDNYLISPPFTISSSATNVEFNFGIGGYQTQEHYAVYWTTDITNASTMNSGLLLEERNSLSNNSEFRSINTSAIAGQTGYLIIRHYNTTGNGILLFDTLTVTESITSGIQTAVNTGTPDQFNINGSGTAYSYDPTSGYIMAGITNNNSFDYGCTDVAVSRSGTGAQSYNGSTSPNFVTDKTFTITPSNTNTSGSTSVTFYFEEAEIAGWESATGLSRTALVIARGNATSVTETTAVTIGSFGTEVTLTGNFTGLNGTYYFGPTNAFVSLCAGVAKIWNGSSWSPSGAPNSTNSVVINGNYDTTSDGNLDACTLTVNTGFTLTINAGEYAKVENNIVVDGTLIVEHQGSLVQVDDSATVTNNGTINVNLTTPNLASRDFMVLGSPMSADTRTGVWNAAFLVLNHLTANFVPNPAVAAAFPGAENF